MSSSTQHSRAARLQELAQALQQLSSLGASLYRTAAGRLEMSMTDIQVIDFLHSVGAATAGQLAEQLGLTTGAIAAMLNRLEEAGIVQRERDPLDGRRVIVRLMAARTEQQARDVLFASLGKDWEELGSQYDDEQLHALVEFLKRSNALTQQKITHLREAPDGEDDSSSAPLGGVERGQLTIAAEATRLSIHAEEGLRDLYRARFEGAMPKIKVRDGVVTIRYPRRLLALVGSKRAAEVALTTTLPWTIAIQSVSGEVYAALGRLQLAGLEVKGGAGMIHVELPVPAGRVPIAISGGSSAIEVRRPAGVATRVHFKGGSSVLVVDGQTFYHDSAVESPGYAAAEQRYEIDISSSASTVTISADA